MMSTPFYSFQFHHLKLDVPYTDIVIDIRSPWSYGLSLGSCLVYVILITWIFPWLKPRSSNTVAKIHHAVLFVYSLFVFLAALYHILITGEIFDWSKFMCTPVSPWLRLVSISFTLSKIWEWGDTAMLLWKGQTLEKIGFLHIYHHATTFLLFLLVMMFPGTEKSGMLLNGFVHTLMYYHFAFRLPKFLRPLITALQILQLMAVTYVWYRITDACPQYDSFPRENRWEYWTPYALVPVYSLFFFKFFIEQYLLRSPKKDKAT